MLDLPAMDTTPTKQQIKAALEITLAVADAIRDLGAVPSGHLYAQLMGTMSLENFQAVIRTLKGAGLVREGAHMLTWIGPEKVVG